MREQDAPEKKLVVFSALKNTKINGTRYKRHKKDILRMSARVQKFSEKKRQEQK